MELQTDDDVPEQFKDETYNGTSIEYLEEELGNINASDSGMPHEPATVPLAVGENASPPATPLQSAYDEAAGPSVPRVVIQGTATRTGTAPTPSGRQLGRGKRYSETAIQNMESKVFKCIETMQADKREHMKRKLELQEKLLDIEERKLSIKQQKVHALNSINENLQLFLNRH